MKSFQELSEFIKCIWMMFYLFCIVNIFAKVQDKCSFIDICYDPWIKSLLFCFQEYFSHINQTCKLKHVSMCFFSAIFFFLPIGSLNKIIKSGCMLSFTNICAANENVQTIYTCVFSNNLFVTYLFWMLFNLNGFVLWQQ